MTDDVETDVPESREITKAVVERLLAEFCSVKVYTLYCPSAPVTGVPAEFLPAGWETGSVPLVLEYGLDMAVPIPDLSCEEGGIRATLSFGRQPCLTFVPYAAVALVRSEVSRTPATMPERPKLRLV